MKIYWYLMGKSNILHARTELIDPDSIGNKTPLCNQFMSCYSEEPVNREDYPDRMVCHNCLQRIEKLKARMK